jgi:hypothetical protein
MRAFITCLLNNYPPFFQPKETELLVTLVFLKFLLEGGGANKDYLPHFKNKKKTKVHKQGARILSINSYYTLIYRSTGAALAHVC